LTIHDLLARGGPRASWRATVRVVGADTGGTVDVTWGLVDPGTLARIVVVSPHFDDAVLGAAHLIARHRGATVVTVLGGRPPAYPAEPTSWDAYGGFLPGDDVVALRREEDRAAMAYLEAKPVWLDFPDHQYLAKDKRPTAAQVAPVLEEALEAASPTAVFLPMGLANPDHVLTHDAGLMARAALAESKSPPAWFCYEDHGYKHIPGILAWRVAKLFKSGLWPTPAVVPIDPDMARKRTAIELYKSQVPPLQRDHVLDERLDANVPEQYWRLEPPPEGWERLTDAV
jgi:LmbE family N-acetylglucosaminyl deacetylase